jgi:hypothetical protein
VQKVDSMDCEIIMFEMERKVFFCLYPVGIAKFDHL